MRTIGGAFGGAYVVLTHVVANSYGLTGIPMIAIVAPIGISNLMHYLIGLGISVVAAVHSHFHSVGEGRNRVVLIFQLMQEQKREGERNEN